MWLVEKKIFYYILDLGYEGVAIPIRVKFEFEIQKGIYVQKSLSYKHLYNIEPLLKKYPNLKPEQIEKNIYTTVKVSIREYLLKNKYLNEDTAFDDNL